MTNVVPAISGKFNDAVASLTVPTPFIGFRKNGEECSFKGYRRFPALAARVSGGIVFTAEAPFTVGGIEAAAVFDAETNGREIASFHLDTGNMCAGATIRLEAILIR